MEKRLSIYLKFMEDYKPIPVSVAMDIAEKFEKDQVLIFAWDSKSGMVHATSWGRSDIDKAMAAQGSQQIMEFLGADRSKNIIYEDPANLLKK